MKTARQLKSSTVKHAARVAWRKVADEAVILDTETAAYYSLDGAGLRIWELIGAGRPLADIVSTLAQEYDAAPEVLLRDCEGLIRRLRKENLVEPS